MKLYIAEKASVGRALADVLPGNRKKEETWICCGSDIVAWASGHLLELYMPEDYDERYKSWNAGTFLYVPQEWKRKEIPRTKTLFSNLKKLIKGLSEKNDVIVNVGDSDREGQLLIDEILEYCGWKGATQRLRINDVNPGAIRKALENVKDNRDYRGEFMAGQARLYTDWLVGLSLTRYVTVSLRDDGYDAGVVSVGRVQTPTLGLVVSRDNSIRNFMDSRYYDLRATLVLEGERQITGRWVPGEACSSALDEQKRLVDRDAAYRLLDTLNNCAGEVVSVTKKTHRQAPPLPYSLSKLQMAASKKYDITDTLVHVQKLYEAGYVTYPRTGCEYIPEGHWNESKTVLETVKTACPELADMMSGVDLTRKSAAWNDAKISEHHAILPTGRAPKTGSISDTERKIYELICVRYVLQFLPEYEYEETVIEFTASGECFRSSGRTVLNLGWQGWETRPDAQEGVIKDDEKDENGDSEAVQILPSVQENEKGLVNGALEEKTTKAPRPFTYHTLLAAMNGIHTFVKDPAVKEKLKEIQGIGTEATQENVILTLFKRGYLEKRKKQIVSTDLGKVLIEILSGGKAAMMVSPDLTAVWEEEMTGIEKGSVSLDDFIARVAGMVRDITTDRLSLPSEILGLKKREQRPEERCPADGCSGTVTLYKSKKDGRLFWKCSTCEGYFDDLGGQPVVRKKYVKES